MKLTRRPHASEGEGRKGGFSRMGHGPRGERGRCGVGWASRQRRRGTGFLFFFFEPIFKCFYKLNFEQISVA